MMLDYLSSLSLYVFLSFIFAIVFGATMKPRDTGIAGIISILFIPISDVFLVFSICTIILSGIKYCLSYFGYSWNEQYAKGRDDRKESIRLIVEGFEQKKSDMRRSILIFTRSTLAVVGVLLVITVSMLAVFAEDIAVEHPTRDLQDTEDVWRIDYEPRAAEPGSDECREREQRVSLTELRRYDTNITPAVSADKIDPDTKSFYTDPVDVLNIIKIVDTKGYNNSNGLNFSEHVTIFTDENGTDFLLVSEELFDIRQITTIYVTYEFDNSEMEVWWMPESHNICILGTNFEGHDLFSKILYGARISLKIGITVAFMTVTLGTIIGSISGYYGGRVDEFIMRMTDVFFAVPGLILAMAFVAVLTAIPRLALPMEFAVLIPLIFLIFQFQSKIDELTSGEVRAQSNEDNSLSQLLNVVGLMSFVLGSAYLFWSFWPQIPFENSLEGATNDDVNMRTLLICSTFILGVIGILSVTMERRGVNPKSALSGLFNSFSFNNPVSYITMRTMLSALAIFILIKSLFTIEPKWIIIQDFDRLWKIQVALIFTGWPGYARLIRGQVLYIREMTFVEAAKSVGAPSSRIMFRHILPNAWAPLLVAFTLDIGGTILSAAGLSFIGLGAEMHSAEWGRMVSDGRKWFLNEWWLVTFPGLAIAFTTLGFNLLGDGLRDVVDPRNRR